MSKFTVGMTGEDGAAPYIVTFSLKDSVVKPFKIEWLNIDPNFSGVKEIEGKIEKLNSIFKEGVSYYSGSFWPSPFSSSRRYLSQDHFTMEEVFSTMEEIGLGDKVIRAIIQDLIVSKFNTGNVVEGLIESNWNVWNKLRMIEDELRIHKFDYERLKSEHEWMKIEIRDLKDKRQ